MRWKLRQLPVASIVVDQYLALLATATAQNALGAIISTEPLPSNVGRSDEWGSDYYEWSHFVHNPLHANYGRVQYRAYFQYLCAPKPRYRSLSVGAVGKLQP